MIPFLSLCVKQVANDANFEKLLTPDVLSERWQFLLASLRENSSVGAFDELVERAEARSSLSSHLVEAGFKYSEAGLYGALLRRGAADKPLFRDWFAAGIASLDKDSWGVELDDKGYVFDAVVELHQRGISIPPRGILRRCPLRPRGQRRRRRLHYRDSRGMGYALRIVAAWAATPRGTKALRGGTEVGRKSLGDLLRAIRSRSCKTGYPRGWEGFLEPV